MNDFKVVDLLYKGDVSDIWQGIHVASNTEVHVVTVNKKVNGQVFDHDRMRDLEPLVNQLSHPHMLKYHKIVQNDNTIGIIMEHPKGGCLRDYLLRRPEKKLSEAEARVFFKQIVSAVEYVNQFNVVFRNLNLRNIFVDRSNCIKIGDFLICTKVGPIYKPTSATSSYHFYAPEIWLEDGRKIDAAADVWSLGVLLYVMTCGCYPFDGKHEFDIFLSVKRGHFAIPSTLSDECASLIKAILHPEASKRPAISQLKNHPWYLGASPAVQPPKRMPSFQSRGSLNGIPEADEEEPNSPGLPILALQNMKIEQPSPQFHHPAVRQPQPPMQFVNYVEPFAPFQPPVELPRQEEPPRARKKRPSADDDVHKVIQQYLEHKRVDNQQLTSNFLSNALGPRNTGEDTFSSSVSRPPPKRRSSDSILHNEEVMRLLGLGAEEQLGAVPFSLPPDPMSMSQLPQQPSQPISRPARSNSSGGEGRRPKVSASPSTKRATKPGRRRSSLDANSALASQSNPGNFVQGFNNIFLPLTSVGSDLPATDQGLQSHSQQMPSSYQMRQMQQQKQARELESRRESQQHLQNLLSDFNPSDLLQDQGGQARNGAQQVQGAPPFLDDELRREIENLHADPNLDPGLDPGLDPDMGGSSLFNAAIEDWIDSQNSQFQ